MTSTTQWRVGACLVCDKAIAKACAACGITSKTNEYTEVEIQWSNGCKMKIGICASCATNHAWMNPQAKEKIKLAHWNVWEKEGGRYDPEVFIV